MRLVTSSRTACVPSAARPSAVRNRHSGADIPTIASTSSLSNASSSASIGESLTAPLRHGGRWVTRLLPVPLHRVGVADLRLVGVSSRVAERSALAKQVPAAVELDLHRPQPPLVLLELAGVLGVGLLATPELVLLGDEVLHARGNVLVAHGPLLTTGQGGLRSCSAQDPA